jgi:hypothetical protein
MLKLELFCLSFEMTSVTEQYLENQPCPIIVFQPFTISKLRLVKMLLVEIFNIFVFFQGDPIIF